MTIKQFEVTVRFRMSWAHFDQTLTDYIISVLKRDVAQHIDKIEIKRVKETPEPAATKEDTKE